MTSVATGTTGPVDAAALEQRVRSRIDSLSYLPTTVAVALKFIELGKNPKAEPSDYATVIGADASLSSKLLALANSPWFGVRNKVTNVRLAVNLLGLGTVRTMAISYCMAGLHNELKLTADESRMFWEAGLCKGVAAKQYARRAAPDIIDEAFVGGMFQDFAVTIMYAAAKEEFRTIIGDAKRSVAEQLQAERDLFHLDHAEVGRILAQKLELPEVLVDAVAFHHNHERLTEFMEEDAMADAMHVAALFPHVLDAWNQQDADQLCAFLEEKTSSGSQDAADFMDEVQKEFNQMYHYFEDATPSETRLADLLIAASKEGADNTAHLVRTVNELMQEAASMGLEMSQLLQSQSKLEDKASHDPLTRVLNREGFTGKASQQLAQASRYGAGFALAFLDVDRFKSINDDLGHEIGDRALKNAASRMQQTIRQHDLVARMGGDEFVLLLYDCQESDAQTILKRILSDVTSEPVCRGKRKLTISLSAGLLYVRPSEHQHNLEKLLDIADKLMYQAKQAGGNRVQTRVV